MAEECYLNIVAAGFRESCRAVRNMPGIMETASKYALQKANGAIRALAVREAAAKYFVKAGDVRKSMTTWAGSKAITVQIKGPVLPLSYFRLSPRRTIRKRGKYLKAAVKRGAGLKPLGVLPFISPKSGRVMERVDEDRYPVRGLYGPAIPQMVGNPETVEKIEHKAKTVFESEYRRQCIRLMGVMK